jgi:hypothetical protein
VPGCGKNRADVRICFDNPRARGVRCSLGLFAAAGLEIEWLYSGELVQNLERWLANSQTPPDRAAPSPRPDRGDAREDLSGTRPYFEDGQWFFRHPTLAVVARRRSTPIMMSPAD